MAKSGQLELRAQQTRRVERGNPAPSTDWVTRAPAEIRHSHTRGTGPQRMRGGRAGRGGGGHERARAVRKGRATLSHQLLDLVVADEHERTAKGAQHVGAKALEHGANALLLHHLDRAVRGALVQPLLRGLLRLHLQAAADRVEGVRDEAGDDGGGLRDRKLGREADETRVVLERVDRLERVEDAEIRAAVEDDADDRDAEAAVHGHDAAGLDGLRQAVDEALKLRLARAHVRREPGARVVERVDDRERAGAGQAAGRNVGREKLTEVGL
mmetsp:Transcript_20190/g.65806  ORF Transcript_20190/g.65806 Transcript_20190/m.65806 type:complete len:270 (+) Transcript_20190:99-908(+)